MHGVDTPSQAAQNPFFPHNPPILIGILGSQSSKSTCEAQKKGWDVLHPNPIVLDRREPVYGPQNHGVHMYRLIRFSSISRRPLLFGEISP